MADRRSVWVGWQSRAYCPTCDAWTPLLVRAAETTLSDVRCPTGHAVVASPGPDDVADAVAGEIVEPGYGAGV